MPTDYNRRVGKNGVITIVLLASVVALTGCSSVMPYKGDGGTPAPSAVANTDSDSPRESAGPTDVSSTPPAATADYDVREYWPLEGDFRVPEFVGMNLKDAKAAANRLRLEVEAEDQNNERVIWAASNWTVVWQDLIAGTSADEGDYIHLRALKNDEGGSSISASPDANLHPEEREFTGIVTGYHRDETLDVATVIVDSAPVRLDLIEPLASGCGEPLKNGLEQARFELEAELPIGQKVLVVMSERYGPDGFIHKLDDSSGRPVAAPPADSVNERLVNTGWWVPSPIEMDGGVGLTGDGPDAVAFTPYMPRSSVRSQAVTYFPLIAKAGDAAVANYTGTIGDCRRAAESDQASYVVQWEENRRQLEQFSAELDRKIRDGYYSCRDGDGDGVCFER